MAQTDKKELFERVPVPKALAAMAIPTVISQLINLIYSTVDTIFIGRTGNSYMMAVVTLAFTIFMMTIAFSNLFGVGGGSLIARLIGCGEYENARKVSAYSVYGAVAVALAYSLLIGVCLDPILYLFGASADTIGYARQYVLLVVVAGNLPMILSMTLAHLLRNVGYSRQASIGLSGGGILNIVLDPLFMFVLLPNGYEVAGAALATLLSNVASCVYLLIVTKKVSKEAALSIHPRDLRGIRREAVRGLYAVGVPSAILTGLFDVANIFLNALMAVHGDLPLAALGIVMKAERLPNAINIGLCQAMLPIVAYNYSSGDHKRMNDTIRVARICGLAISVVSVVLFSVFASPVVQVFMSTSAGDTSAAVATLSFAVIFLRCRCFASPAQFLNYHSSFCMQAMGNGCGTFLHAVARELVFYIPFMYILNAMFGKEGLVFALVVGEACGAVFAILLVRQAIRKKAAFHT